MENSIIVVEDFDSISLIIDSQGYPIPVEDVTALVQEALNGVNRNVILFREECIVVDDEEQRLFIISDDPNHTDDRSELENFIETLEARIAEQGWYAESVDPGIEDCINLFLSGEYDDEEGQDELERRGNDDYADETGDDEE